MPFFWLLPLAAGLGLGWFAGRRAARKGRGMGMEISPHLLPDPAAQWLMRAHQAAAVWVLEPDEKTGEPRLIEHVAPGAGFRPVSHLAVQPRLERARVEEKGGVERLDEGMLLFGAVGGIAAGLLLPGETPAGARAEAQGDLDRLIDGLRRRPVLQQIAKTPVPGKESVETVGMNLAYLLERLVNSDVLVAVDETTGPRVVGFSGRVDKRAMHTTATPDSPMARVARGEAPYLRVAEDPLGRTLPDRRRSPLPVTIVPFADEGECVGAIAMWLPDGRRPGTPAMIEAESAIRKVVPRMVYARRFHQEEEKSVQDPLTGLKNRRGLAADMARINQEDGALVYVDLDKFKSLNDVLGHPAGDAALVHLAGLLRRLMRDGDVVARIGGEEFAVWAPGAPLDRGVQIAERIRGALEITPWGWQGRTWPLTASFGVAACPETSPSQKNLPGQADAALYQAKKGGRNRVVAAERK